MPTVTGVVQGVYSKDVTTKFGNKKVWDIKLDDGQFYKNGFKKPIAEIGDTVFIEYTPDKYGNTIISLIRGAATTVALGPQQLNAEPVKPAASPTQYNKGNKPFPVPSDHGDRSIIRQNSLTNARELVCTVALRGKDTLGESKMWSDTQKQLETLSDEIIKIAYKFEEYSSGDREVKAVDALMNSEASKVKKPKLKVVKIETEEGDSE